MEFKSKIQRSRTYLRGLSWKYRLEKSSSGVSTGNHKKREKSFKKTLYKMRPGN